MKNSLFKRLGALWLALAAAAVSCVAAFGSVTVESPSGGRIEVKNGSVVIERHISGGSALNSIIIHNPSENEKGVNSEGGKASGNSQNSEDAAKPESSGSEAETGSFSDYVYETVRLTNEERAKYGLAELKISSDLCEIAQDHAEDMYENNIFSHTFSNGDTIEDRVKGEYSCLGENIAKGYTSAEAVVEGWMNSEGHRANILNEAFTEIGIGYQNGYWVQVFKG